MGDRRNGIEKEGTNERTTEDIRKRQSVSSAVADTAWQLCFVRLLWHSSGLLRLWITEGSILVSLEKEWCSHHVSLSPLHTVVNYCFPAVVATEGFIWRIEMVVCVASESPGADRRSVRLDASSFVIYNPPEAGNAEFQMDVWLTGEHCTVGLHVLL